MLIENGRPQMALIPVSEFQRIFEAIPVPCLILDPEYTIVAVNDAYLHKTMTQRAEILGHAIFEIFPDNPNDQEASGVANLRASLQRALVTRQPDSMPVQRHDIRRPPDAQAAGEAEFEERYWSPLNVPVMDERGDVVYLVHRVEDVTDFIRLSRDPGGLEENRDALAKRIRNLEIEMFQRARELHLANQRLRDANETLLRLDQAKAAFFTDISHELRTPLALILGPIEEELAETDPPLPAGQRERLEVAYRNSLRLLTLVDTLLDLERVEAGKAGCRFEATDLASLTADVAGNFRSLCAKAGLTLTIDCPPLPEPVYVDRSMWNKIVLNLLSNAFRFTLQGGITLRLQAVAGKTVELQVSDTGSGIPTEEQSRIFERFHRVKGTQGRSVEGTGVGLALVRELAYLHGGSIRVHSVPDMGSTFVVHLPLGNTHLPPANIVPSTPLSSTAMEASSFVNEALSWLPEEHDAPARTIGGPHKRIVFAEDNADMRDYVCRLLRKHYDVEAVENGEKALAAVHRQLPDLVLTDVMMPRLDGLGLLRILRTDPRTCAIPVVLLSTNAGEDIQIEGRAAGADDCLVKPFSARELLAHIAADIDMARLRLEVGAAERRVEAGRKAQILIVDNNPVDRDYLQALLGAFGYHVVQAENGEQALAIIHGGKPNLVITDLLMPKLDGFELIRRLRSDPETDAIRIIVYSPAFQDEEARTFCEILGVDRFLRKPTFVNELLGVIGEVVRTPPVSHPMSPPILATLENAYRRLMSDALYRRTAELEQEIQIRRQIEIELRESDQHLRLAQQIGKIGTFDWKIKINQLQWSAEIARLHGLGPHRFESAPDMWRKFVHPDDMTALDEKIKAALHGGNFEGEWRVRWPDGSVHWLSGRAVVYMDDSGQPEQMLGVNIDITEHKEAEEQNRRALQHDPLTHLPNRALLYEFVEHMLPAMRREHALAAFLFVDLDRFKPINDTYGHDVGDDVLKEVAQRLSTGVRGEDLIGRIGGDEFVAVLPHIHNEQDAATIASHLIEQLDRPYRAGDVEIHISPSIGISLFPRDGQQIDELIKHADDAMYLAKQRGRNNFQFFQAGISGNGH